MPVEARAHARATAVALAVAAVVAAAVGPGAPVAGKSSTADATAYPWPVKPFDESHAIRSTVGDPRTWFDGPPTAATLYHGTGSFSFHQGVDIVVPDGTPVYPVESGVVTLSQKMKVFVRPGRGRSQQYWHIVPAVRVGQTVVASTTVLGNVRRSYGHVHFSDVVDGRAVNPLAPGRLTPYVDHTPPRVGPVELLRPATGAEVLPELVRGRVEIGVVAGDRPDRGGPGMWTGLPTTPAVVAWKVEQAADDATVVPTRKVFDVRKRVPRAEDFWKVYLRGTHQNMATFKLHRFWRQQGLFVFRLGELDTRRLADGIYTISVTALDIRGNAATAREVFTVYNHPGWPAPTPQT